VLCEFFLSTRFRDWFKDKLTDAPTSDAVGIMTLPNAATIQRKAHEAWLCGIIFSTISAFYSLIEFRNRQQTNAVECNDQAEQGLLQEWVAYHYSS
jgi:hypothetical protein